VRNECHARAFAAAQGAGNELAGKEEEKVKQEYKKPQVVKVSLKVEQTVLAGCKLAGTPGPSDANCMAVSIGCQDISQPS